MWQHTGCNPHCIDLVPSLIFLKAPPLYWFLINKPIWWLPCSRDIAVGSVPTCRLPPNANREPELVVAVWSFPREFFFFSAALLIDYSAVNMGEGDASGSIVHCTCLHQVWQLACALHSAAASFILPSTLIIVWFRVTTADRTNWSGLRKCLSYWLFLSLRMRLIFAYDTVMQPRIVQ
jgi:hypothetical protein